MDRETTVRLEALKIAAQILGETSSDNLIRAAEKIIEFIEKGSR